MTHLTLPRFWQCYEALPVQIQALADRQYNLLKQDPFYPSLHFKKVGTKNQLWSVRVGQHYRALGLDVEEGVLWFWIGTHADYDNLLARM